MTPKEASDIQSKQTALAIRPATRHLEPMPKPSMDPGTEDKFPDYEPADKAAQYADITGSPGRVFSPSVGPTSVLPPSYPIQAAEGAALPAIPPVVTSSAITPFKPIGGALAATEEAATVAAPAAAGLGGAGLGLGLVGADLAMQGIHALLAGARSPQGSVQDFLPARSGGGQDAAGQAVNQMLGAVLNKMGRLNSRAGGP
jgi:hypothetical protein